MNRLSALLAVVVLCTLFSGCGGSSSTSTQVAPTTGSLTVAGSPTVTNALSAPKLYSAQKTTIDGDPTSVKIKAYKIYLAQNANCSNPVLVGDKTATAVYQELLGATKPTLFTASSVTPGTYNCMIMKVSDVFKFTPNATAVANSGGLCTANTEVSFDIHKTEIPDELWYDLDTHGTNTGAGTFATAVEQTVFLYASTNPGAITANNSLIASTQVFPAMPNPVVITAGQTTKAAFVVDTINRMSVSTGFCWLEGFVPAFISQ